MFIEPRYNPPHQNDDHPPHNVVRAQELLASVYNAIRTNDGLWNSTLLIVLYDEHGGFYDHVIPPSAVSPDGLNKEGCDFKQLGVRVPAVFVSPWIEKSVFGRTEGMHFDHTSILRYLCDKDGWNLEPLKERVRAAENFAAHVNWTDKPRIDMPRSIIMPAVTTNLAVRAATGAILPVPMNENQEGLAAFMVHMGHEHHHVPKRFAMRAAPIPPAIMPPDLQTAKANFQHWIAESEGDM